MTQIKIIAERTQTLLVSITDDIFTFKFVTGAKTGLISFGKFFLKGVDNN